MSYVLSHMSDDNLDRLISEAYAERDRRIKSKIPSLPAPVLSGDRVKDIRSYRDTYRCSLHTARLVIDFWKQRG